MSGNKDSRYGGHSMKLEAMKNANNPDGVAVDPMPVSQGDEVTVLYYGPLAESAQQLYMHCGYGDADNWQQVQDLRMEQTDRGWVKTFQVKESSRLNFCFHNENNTWDNNNGLNWSLEIHRGD